MLGRLLSLPVAVASLAGLVGAARPAVSWPPAPYSLAWGTPAVPAKVRVWVSNDVSGTVLPIDPVTGRAGTAARVRHPLGLVVTPDGRSLFVLGPDAVTPVKTASARPGKSARVGRIPGWPVASPDSKTVYVAVRNTVVPIRVPSGRAGQPIVAAKSGTGPQGLAIAPGGRTVYAVDGRAVRPIDTVTKTARKPIHTGLLAGPMVITPDGRTGYALGRLGVVFPVDLAADTVRRPIRIGGLYSDPMALAILPDGKTVYAVEAGNGTVVPISTARNRAGTPVKVGPAPFALAVTSDGRAVYVLAYRRVIPIDTKTNTAGKPIRVPFIPTSFAITPDGRTVWVSGYRQRIGGAVLGFVLPIRTSTNQPGSVLRTGKGFPCLVIKPWRTGQALGPSACD